MIDDLREYAKNGFYRGLCGSYWEALDKYFIKYNKLDDMFFELEYFAPKYTEWEHFLYWFDLNKCGFILRMRILRKARKMVKQQIFEQEQLIINEQNLEL